MNLFRIHLIIKQMYKLIYKKYKIKYYHHVQKPKKIKISLTTLYRPLSLFNKIVAYLSKKKTLQLPKSSHNSLICNKLIPLLISQIFLLSIK